MKQEMEDKNLERAIKELPVLEPDATLWKALEAQLDTTKEKTSKNIFWKKSFLMKVAASLILSVTIGFLLRDQLSANSQVMIHYGEEIIASYEGVLADFREDKAFDGFISHQCGEMKEICEKPEFKSLMNQLNEVQEEKAGIIQLMEVAGADVTLFKAKGKVEKEEARIKREVVKLLKS